MKRARPPLSPQDVHRGEALLTTTEVAGLLRVHPKHIYRLLRRGLPGHRVGGEWRFFSEEVLRWSGAPPAPRRPGRRADPVPRTEVLRSDPAPLVAANGDLVVEYLLSRLTATGLLLFGHVQADRSEGLELLKQGKVLAAGCHGNEIPGELANQRLAFIHLVDRQVGLAVRRGLRVRSLRTLGRLRLASRPRTAGVRVRFDHELRRLGVDPDAAHAGAVVLPSHREVVCAVARGEADVGLASLAWSGRVGLDCLPLCREPYGLLVRASLLGDPRVVRLCEVAQDSVFRREVGTTPGYDARLTGTISYLSPTKSPS